MKILPFLKAFFILSVLLLIAANAFILINFFKGDVIPGILPVLFVSVGVVGVIVGSVWYNLKAKAKAKAEAAEQEQK